MGLLDDIKGMVSQYTAGAGSAEDMRAQFHRVVDGASPAALSQGVTEALRSDQTPPFAQMVSELFAQASPDQKAGMLNALLGAATPEMRAKLASMIPGAGGAVSSSQAGSIPPDVVSTVAGQLEQHNPGVVDKMGSFYAQHPQLVKALGMAAMIVAIRKIAEHHG